MKSKIKYSIGGTILLVLIMAHMTALGQAPPAPGPEHEILNKMAGTWNCKVIMGEDESQATSTSKMECGGLWLITDFRGSFGGMMFQGRGADSYDPVKGKYVSVWVDSMSTRPMMLEGSYDKQKKTLTMFGEALGPDGKPAKHKGVTQMPDNDHQTFTMYLIGADGQENKVMTIEYTRKK